MNWAVYALLGAFFAGITNVLVAAGLKHVDSNVATAVRTVFVLPVVWLIAWYYGNVSGLSQWSLRTWIFLALSALATGLSWVYSYKAIALAGAGRPAPIDKSSLLFTMILAWLFLKEILSPRDILAGGLVLAGILVSVLAPRGLGR